MPPAGFVVDPMPGRRVVPRRGRDALRCVAVPLIVCSLWSCALTPIAAQEPAGYLTELEAELVREHNTARTDPAAYADLLEERLQYFDGNLLRLPGQIALVTREGRAAVEEAIRFLRRARPLPPLGPSRAMSRAARDHVRDQGPSGQIGHGGTDGSGPGDRLERYGIWSGRWAENISYGHGDARHIVIQLVVDDAVPDRGHRANIFHSGLFVLGVACGRHAAYGAMCVIDYAGDYEETE